MAETAPSNLVRRFIESSEVEGREHAPLPRKYRLTQGERVSGTPGRYLYRFETRTKIPINDESSPSLLLHGRRYPAALQRKSGLSLEIVLTSDLGSDLPEAVLCLDGPALAENLCQRLRELESLQRPFNAELAAKLFEYKQLDPNPRLGALPPFEGLSDEQQQAAAGLSALEAGFLWGPPGTGKSVTLAAIAHGAFASNRRTLLVSHTNEAVDSLLEALCKRISGRARLAIPEGAVIRLGAISRDDLSASFGSQIELESVLSRAQEKTSKRLEAMRADHARLREKIAQMETSAVLVRSEESLQSKLLELKAKKRVARPGLFATLRRVFLGAGTVEEVLVDETADLKAEIELVQSGLKKIAIALGTTERSRLVAELSDAKVEDAELATAVARLEEVLREVRRGVLGNARVVATTATRAIMTPEQLSGFDLVVIEEASMLALPVVYLLAGLAETQVIVAGDFRQLPPIALSTAPIVREWYARDIFEASGIVDALERNELPHAFFSLGTQFRCREEVARVFSSAFYSGSLSSAYEPKLALEYPGTLAPLSARPVVLVDTSHLAPRGLLVGRSKANLVHAAFARELWRELVSAVGSGLHDSSVGIVAPYRPQVALLRELVNEEAGTDVAIGTVHRFQGSERPVVVLDLTESAPHRLGSFLGGTSRRDTGARLLNVALSRAKEQLIILADLAHLRLTLAPGHVLYDILAKLEAQEAVVDAAELLPQAADRVGRSQLELHTRAMFLSALIDDLRRASGSCLMVAPSLSTALVKVVANAVATRAERLSWKVVVPQFTVGVCPSRDEYEVSLDLIAQVGGKIEYTADEVSPLVVVDDAWTWTGRLSPLSCLESDSGAMARISGRAAADAARRLLVPSSSSFLPERCVVNS